MVVAKLSPDGYVAQVLIGTRTQTLIITGRRPTLRNCWPSGARHRLRRRRGGILGLGPFGEMDGHYLSPRGAARKAAMNAYRSAPDLSGNESRLVGPPKN